MKRRGVGLLAIIGPGLLIAATGVGAGDLATAGFTGSMLGVSVAWAVVLGAAFKYLLTEGLARHQLVTGDTLLAGLRRLLGPLPLVLFLPYLALWTFFVARALFAATGAVTLALVERGGLAYAVPEGVPNPFLLAAVQTLLVAALALFGSFKVFERAMAGLVAAMFLATLIAAAFTRPDVGTLLIGFVPSVPEAAGKGASSPLAWTIALIGGVGGTVTILCYGYWIAEQGRTSARDLAVTRIDLGVGYAATALFGVAMLVIASAAPTATTRGAGLLIELARSIDEAVGTWAGWAFLVGAWAAMVTSLLGVWQAVPYLWADTLRLVRGSGGSAEAHALRRSWTYRAVVALMTLSAMGSAFLATDAAFFKRAQFAYAFTGALFIPLVALALLIVNRKRVMSAHYNRMASIIGLVLTLAFFVAAGVVALR